MKIEYIFLIAFFFFFLKCKNCENEVLIERDVEGFVLSETPLNCEGLIHGIKKNYLSGTSFVKETQEYKMGKKNGVFRRFYSNKKTAFIEGWKNNKKDGESTQFYFNGNIKWREQYMKDMRVGVYEACFENGEMSFVKFFDVNSDSYFVMQFDSLGIWKSKGHSITPNYSVVKKEGDRITIKTSVIFLDSFTLIIDDSSNGLLDWVYDESLLKYDLLQLELDYSLLVDRPCFITKFCSLPDSICVYDTTFFDFN